MYLEESNYQKALDFLYGFVDYSLTRQLRYSPEKFNLDRMYRFMELLNNPHTQYPIVHIAGTKGKGSTAAMIANILSCTGLKVGLYTSPHLQDFCERIQVNGEPISHEELVQQIEDIKKITPLVPEITTFELTTALGFKVFAEAKVDFGVIEVGLGGRLDATNIVDPLLSVITSLSYDHMKILGDTIELIAVEKGGIIKTGHPVVLSPQVPEAHRVIEEMCIRRHAPLVSVEKNYNYKKISHTLYGQVFQVWKISKKNGEGEIPHTEYSIPLLGAHQVENAITTIAAIECIRASGFSVTEDQIQRGLNSVKWPGRFEIISYNPMIIIDSAHNVDSAKRLAQTIDDYLESKTVYLIFGASEDKDVGGMFANLAPRVKGLIVTQSDHPRAMDANILVKLAGQSGTDATLTLSVEEALKRAKEMADDKDVILCTGSLFIAAAVRDLLGK